MKISVILCTYNRADRLAKALESIAASEFPHAIAWEIVVVDNNSPDHTRQIVGDFRTRFGDQRIRYLFEPKQGKSHALNAGIREAKGDILAFVDDDVTVERAWLANLTFVLHDPDLAGAGGRILPEPGFSAPSWLSEAGRYALAPFAFFEPRVGAGPLLEAPFGTNMAFRKDVFGKHGEFRTDLGPRPGTEIRNEDTEFGQRVLDGGDRLAYVPEAIVYHPVEAKRLEKQYHLIWWYDKGRADIRQSGRPPGAQFVGVPIFLYRRICRWSVRWIVAFRPSHRFAAKLRLWNVMGMVVECFSSLRNPSGPSRARS